MNDPRRKLLDDPIENLKALREAGQLAYTTLAGVPAVAEIGPDQTAHVLADLVCIHMEKLGACLGNAEHLFGGEKPEACEKAENLLVRLHALLQLDAVGDPAKGLVSDPEELAKILAKRWRDHGMPDWGSVLGCDALAEMADRVGEEVNAAIRRLEQDSEGDAGYDPKPNAKKRGNINGEMLDMLQKNPESLKWPIRQWGGHFGVSISVIHDQPAWGTLMTLREAEKLERIERERERQPKGPPRKKKPQGE